MYIRAMKIQYVFIWFMVLIFTSYPGIFANYRLLEIGWFSCAKKRKEFIFLYILTTVFSLLKTSMNINKFTIVYLLTFFHASSLSLHTDNVSFSDNVCVFFFWTEMNLYDELSFQMLISTGNRIYKRAKKKYSFAWKCIQFFFCVTYVLSRAVQKEKAKKRIIASDTVKCEELDKKKKRY